MNSFRISDHCENAANINISQCSGDLFQESPQLECNIDCNFNSAIKVSNEKSSETSDEFSFATRRKPRRALSFSHDSSHCYSKKSNDSLQNDSNMGSSKFFKPISPVCEIDKISSSSLLESIQSGSPEAYMTPGIHNLSKENVAVISFVSESEHSDSSSILDDSQKSENGQNFKHFFKTPICSSVKKRTIRQWLSNVSLNCSLKPNENGSYRQQEFIASESSLLRNQNDSKIASVNVSISSSDNKKIAHEKTYDLKKLEDLNVSEPGNSYDSNRIEKSEDTANFCPWLFDSFGNQSKEYSMKPYDVSHKNPDDNNSDSCQIPDKSVSFKTDHKLSKPLDISFHENCDRNISRRGNHSLNFNKNTRNHKSDDSKSLSLDDSDSSANEICNSNPSKIIDSDDSFTNIRLFKKKNKKNCLNISSDDSEAKDTANESEDNPHHNNELCTPRRRLYFRNPLNNSLDDDATPLTNSKDYSICSKDNSGLIKKATDTSTGLLNQICSEVHNIDNSAECSLRNQSDSINKYNDGDHDVLSDSALFKKSCPPDTGLSVTPPAKELNENTGSVSLFKSNSIRHSYSSFGEQDDAVQINFSSLSLNSTSKNNTPESDHTSIKDSYESRSASINETQIDEVHDSSNKLPSKLDSDDSPDSIVNIKRKSKKNILNFSSDSFCSENTNTEITDINKVSDNEPSPSIDLTKSDDEYDKYMYRTRSDSSFSDNEVVPDISKDSSEVISVHTTTSEEEGDNEGNAPWFDLESYLKKNIPASSKSFDSSFLKNSEKINARLAKISLPTHSSCPYHTSFLLSLTPDVPDEMCHPEAVKYRGESFSKHKNELVDLLFKLFNREIFEEKLPPLEIKWSGHLTTTSGITKSSSKITKNGKIRNSVIKLSKTVVNDASKVRDVLLHELCHAANWLIDEQAGGHGPLFKKWVNKIWIKFPEVPKVKTTHHYELKWKYLYKCSYCGYELGKMKLSLNETSCRLCGGLVTVNT